MNKRHAAALVAGIACAIAFQADAAASEKIPLPSIFFQAKTVAVVNDTDQSYMPGRVSTELKKWGRYQVVAETEDADLVLVLAMQEDLVGLERNPGTRSYTTVYGNAGSDQSQSAGRAAARKSTTVAFFDGRTGRKVWSETRVLGSAFDSAATAMIKELSKRVEKAEKDMTRP